MGLAPRRYQGLGPGRTGKLWPKPNTDTGGEFAWAARSPGFRLPGSPVLPKPRLIGRWREFATSINTGTAQIAVEICSAHGAGPVLGPRPRRARRNSSVTRLML